MNLIALLIGLVIERLATQWFHWRRMRWLDRIIDVGIQAGTTAVAAGPPCCRYLAGRRAGVAGVRSSSSVSAGPWPDSPTCFSPLPCCSFRFGPTDIGEEVDEYCKALEGEDDEAYIPRPKRSSKVMCRRTPASASGASRSPSLCRQTIGCSPSCSGLCLLGPLGAWAYRVTDLIRRRAVFNAARSETTTTDDSAPFAMPPSRCTAGWHGSRRG